MVDIRNFSIGEAARASELSVKAIRYYEEIGIIPKARRTNGGAHTGGQRLYTMPDVERLRFIHRPRLLGLGLAAIRKLVALSEARGKALDVRIVSVGKASQASPSAEGARVSDPRSHRRSPNRAKT